MKLALSPLVLLISLGLSPFALAQSLDLSSIPEDSRTQIRKSNPDLLRAPFTNKKMDQLIKRLHQITGAKQVSADLIGSSYKVKIQLPPKVADIQWDGAEDLDLNSLNTVFRIREGDLFQRSKLDEAMIRLKSYLVAQSYLQAELEATANQNADSEMEIKIKITKNASCKIQSIVLETQSDSLRKRLQSDLDDFINEEYSEENISSMQISVRNYLVENRYLLAKLTEPKIEVSEDRLRAKIYFRIENSNQFEFSFFGNKEISTSKILESVQWNELSSINSDIGSQIKDKIIQHYKNNAFTNVNVELTPLNNKDGKELIRFDIQEGERTRITEWKLIGSYSKDSDYYINTLKDLSGPNTRKSHFVQSEIEEAVLNLNIALQNKGYLSSVIGLDRIEWIGERKYVKVYLNIDEGPATILRKVTFKGLKAFSKEQVLKEIELRENQNLNLNQLENSVSKIRNLYLQNAYLDFVLKNENDQIVTYSNNNSRAEILFELEEGPQIEVKNILVQGLNTTKASVVTRSLAFKEGDSLSLERIRESESNLQVLGIFSSIDIRPAPGTSAKRTILVNVRERDPGVFTLGLGFTDENKGTVKSFTGLVYKNLGGSAKVFQSRIEIQKQLESNAYLQNKLTVSYLEPFLFNKRLKGRTSLSFAQDIDFLNSNSTETIIKETREIDFFIEKDVSRNLKLGWKLWGISGTRRFELDRKVEQDKLQVASIGPFIELDHRDHPFTPRDGTYTLFNLEYASPNLGSSEKIFFSRYTGAFNQYIPLDKSKNYVIAYSLRGGYVKNLGEKGSLAIPQEKMFFLGGRSTVRGFDLSEIPYKNDIESLKPADRELYYVTDSSTFGLVKIEFRFPVYGDLGAAIFYDGGIVEIPEITIEDPYRHSIGFGFRYNTPVGPLSIEYGFKLDKKDYENQGRLHLSIGAF